MADRSFLSWPFFDEEHRTLAAELDAWAAREVEGIEHGRSLDDACRALVRALGEAGWLRLVVQAEHGGARAKLDVRSLCLAREILARHSGLSDFAFAMQGLGTGAISLFGTDELKAQYLPPVRGGQKIAAFALTEPEGGSDAANLRTSAKEDGSFYILDGRKTWISNGGVADH